MRGEGVAPEAQPAGQVADHARGVLEGGLAGVEGAEHFHQHDLAVEGGEVGVKEVRPHALLTGREALGQDRRRRAGPGRPGRHRHGEEPQIGRVAGRPRADEAAGLPVAQAVLDAAGLERIAVKQVALEQAAVVGPVVGAQVAQGGQERRAAGLPRRGAQERQHLRRPRREVLVHHGQVEQPLAGVVQDVEAVTTPNSDASSWRTTSALPRWRRNRSPIQSACPASLLGRAKTSHSRHRPEAR